jgi:hypothetical protein
VGESRRKTLVHFVYQFFILTLLDERPKKKSIVLD